jgi:membrane fusion protein (multidrug efflux system)
MPNPTRYPARAPTVVVALGALGALGAFAACSRTPPPAAAPPAVDVKVVVVQPSTTDIYADFVGEVRGSQEVEIRARVGGILLSKHFNDGALVRKGDLLYTIDAREYRAQLASAEAQLASAEANLMRARQDVVRYEPLLAENAISRQVYDNAVAAARQAQAQVAATRASIAEARLGVEYAEVRAPLTGRIGASKVFEGSLITAGTTLLAEISTDDPAWVYFSVSEAMLLNYQRRYGAAERSSEGERAADPVRLRLSDGTEYALPGFINFADRALDPTTGTYSLRAEFPNPDHTLVPGLFARIRVIAEEREGVIVVPDRAVQQQLGRYFVTVVGKDEKAEVRPVELGARLGNRWVVDGGLAAGDRVVVEGILKARPGTPLKAAVVDAASFDSAAAAPSVG